jgi:hypothetical protein
MDKNMNFRVDLRLLLELGERLISRDEIAVVELVKNAYDADAESVEVKLNKDRIEVSDNGEGMNREAIEDGWLTIGTVKKRLTPKTKKGRRVLGEKGLGRLAVLRLGKRVTLLTQKRGSKCYRLIMDWGKTRTELEKPKYRALDEMNIGLAEVKEEIFKEGHGTRIVIEELAESWDKNKTEKLQTFLSRLVEPSEESKTKFEIKLFSDKIQITVEAPGITKKPHYSIEIDLDDDGNYSGLLKWNMDRGEGKEKINNGKLADLRGVDGSLKKWKSLSEGGCGGFRFRLNAWDLDASELRGQKNILKLWTGISLHRDGFRVVQPDVDWLGLDLRRVQNPTLRLSTNQIIGNVFISSDNNPNLIDKTDREGIVVNESLAIMKSAIYHFMNLLELRRYGLRRKKSLSRGVIFSYLDTSPLQSVAKKLPSEQKKIVEDYATKIDSFKEMLEEWILGRDRMATMGMLGARLVHEARSALMKITDNYPLIEKHIDKLDELMKERVGRMVEGGKMLSKIFADLDPFLKFRGKKRKDVVLKDVLESIKFLFTPEINKNGIKIVNAIPDSIIFRANPTDIYVMLANFLDNSIYWVKDCTNKERVIEFRAKESDSGLTIEVADSGTGIAKEIEENIFEAGVTAKEGGTGLGLSIVKDIVDFYGGTVEAGEDEKLKGALFTINVPIKGV